MKRGLAAPLLFLALALAAWGSADASPSLCAGALLALAVALRALPSDGHAVVTPLAICAAAFALWIMAINQFANPSYSAAAPYHAALLFGGYLIGRRAAADRAVLYGAALAFGVVVAGWALWQQVTLAEQRAHGLFITPATLASTINLLLAPGLAFVVFGPRRASLVAVLVLLSMSLAASQSRGGWIALAVACAVSLLLARRAGLRPVHSGLAIALGILAIGAIGGGSPAAVVGDGADFSIVGKAGQSLQARFELYALAADGIASGSWFFGSGYQAFYYLLESSRGAVPSYSAAATYFVHNDYLQMLLEFGVPGLAGLLFLVILPFGRAWRALPRLGEERLPMIAVVAALTSMAVHGVMDFPFFIPLCVLMYGAAVGLCDAMALSVAPETVLRLPAALAPARRALVAALAAFAIWVLGVPVAAEAAALYAQKQWREGQSERSAFWFEAARRIDPRDWRYHWYAGQFWANLAVARADPAAARLADAALAASQAANSREVRSLYERVVLHRRLRRLLAPPADPETLDAWTARAVTLAPTDPNVLAERARVLRQLGAHTGAR